MEFAYTFSGKAPILKRYQIAATVSRTGIPLLLPAANGAGLALATTTGAAGLVGVAQETATYATAQQSDGSDPSALVQVAINPDAVYKAKLSGAATSDTALVLHDVTTTSTDGLTITTGDNHSSPTFDEGTVFAYDGANAGEKRKITSVGTSTLTVTVAFTNDVESTDNIITLPYTPMQTQSITLTSNLDQIDCSKAVSGTAAEFVVVDDELRDSGRSGTTNSFAFLHHRDHALSNR